MDRMPKSDREFWDAYNKFYQVPAHEEPKFWVLPKGEYDKGSMKVYAKRDLSKNLSDEEVDDFFEYHDFECIHFYSDFDDRYQRSTALVRKDQMLSFVYFQNNILDEVINHVDNVPDVR